MPRGYFFILTQNPTPFLEGSIHLTFTITAVLLRIYPQNIQILVPGSYIDIWFWGLATLSFIFAMNSISNGNSNSKHNTNMSSTVKKVKTSPNYNKKKKNKSPNHKIASGVKILQARYGTSSKDVDVTSIVQNMVDEQSVLKIPSSMSFNKIFGDPHSFRRKKLRLIGQVNGKPFVETINEIRWKDFSIDGSVKKDNGNNTDGDEGAGTLYIEQEDENVVAAPSSDGNGSNYTYHPCVNTIMNDFKMLASSNVSSFAELETEPFLQACLHVADLIDLFGSSFLPVKVNITDNVAKIRKNVKKMMISSSAITEEGDDNDDYKYPDTKIGDLIQVEVKNKVARKDGSVCISALWLKRALDFMVEFFMLLSNGSDTFDASQKAFKTKLAPWQGWTLQITCKTALRLIPSRASFVKIFVPNMAQKSPSREDYDQKELQVEALKEALKNILNCGLSKTVEQMDSWYTEENLDFPDKC
eukprot:g6424.t1